MKQLTGRNELFQQGAKSALTLVLGAYFYGFGRDLSYHHREEL